MICIMLVVMTHTWPLSSLPFSILPKISNILKEMLSFVFSLAKKEWEEQANYSNKDLTFLKKSINAMQFILIMQCIQGR